MMKDFKEFVARGNVVDMAVGIAVGAAFGAIAKSLVDDVVMPVVGLALSDVEFANLFYVMSPGDPAGPYGTLEAAKEAGAVTINYGLFINSIITFVIIAFAIYMMVRAINRSRREEEASPAESTEKDCPFCALGIPIGATRCPHCTSQLQAAG
jgi:large conductance mechanosensitive channel